MTDLDSLLQDFSYLKSLQHKNEAPKRVSKKLQLSDPSVHHVVRAIFNKTGECTFDRIYNRPLGYRCLKECFAADDFKMRNPGPSACIAFLDRCKELYADKAKDALAIADDIRTKHLHSEQFRKLFASDEELFAKFEKRFRALERTAEKHPDTFFNTKDLFSAMVPAAKKYLAGQPWEMFLQSPYFIRYCQWKHLEANMKISEDDFDVHRIIGRGGFGEVFPCRKRDTGAVFAMKKLDKKRLKLKQQEGSAVHERNVLAEMNSSFVTNLKYAFQDKSTLFLIMDLLEGGDLQFHLRRKEKFSEWETKFYAAQIIMGLSHIHSRNMIYRDLKPANILLDGDGNARISDLGLVRDKRKGLPTSECGTVGYMAPEVIKSDEKYDTDADWFSLGVVIYQFLTGKMPFRSSSSGNSAKKEIQQKTLETEPKYPDFLSETAKDLLSKLLEKDPAKRLGHGERGASQIRRHPFFADLDWQALVDQKLEPAIKPFQGQVNARDVYDIERFDDTMTKGVVVTPEDNAKYYGHFDHIMSHQWQEEVLGSVYDLISMEGDKGERKKLAKKSRRKSKPQTDEDHILLQGYMLKQGGALGRAWRRRYVILSNDAIMWSAADGAPVSKSMPLSEITSVDTLMNPRKGQYIHIVAQSRELDLMAEAESDKPIWYMYLQDAVRLATGDHVAQGSKHLHKRPSVTSLNDDLEDLRQDAVDPLQGSVSEEPAAAGAGAGGDGAQAPAAAAEASTGDVFESESKKPAAEQEEDASARATTAETL